MKNNWKSRKREYGIWSGIKARCNNPKATGYCWYGARGIKVCKNWNNSFDCFFKDMGECPSGYELDRINNDGDYEPSNCRWTTHKENCKSRRMGNPVCVDGIAFKNKITACKFYKITPQIVYTRLYNGWNINDAFKSPVRDESFVVKGIKFKIFAAACRYFGVPREIARQRIEGKWHPDNACTIKTGTKFKRKQFQELA